MRSRLPLTLMEQVIMVLVFAMAAAICVQAFVLSNKISRGGSERDQAVITAESVAEMIKSCRGNGEEAAEQLGGIWQRSSDGGTWRILYDEGWTVTDNAAAYNVCVTVTGGSAGSVLGSANIAVCDGNVTVIYSLSVCWQLEVSGNA